MVKGIVVLKYYSGHGREVNLNLINPLYPQMGKLSDLDLDSLIDIIRQLELLTGSDSANDCFEWGVDLFSVTSFKQVSICYNETEGINLPNVPTDILLTFMNDLKNFKQAYQDIGKLKTIVGKAFSKVIGKPSEFKVGRSTYYDTNLDGINVSMNLSEPDLQLSVSTYTSQLNIV